MTKADRRAQRTRELLQQALIDLIRERAYDAVTIQDIADRANVGRTTFYLHFSGKDALFISCHEAIVHLFGFGPHVRLSRDALLSPEAPAGMVLAYRHLEDVRRHLAPMVQGKDGLLILQRLRAWCAAEIETTLHAAFEEDQSTMPFDVLAQALAGTQIGLLSWWLQKRQPHSAEQIARVFHRVQRAAICDAFGMLNDVGQAGV